MRICQLCCFGILNPSNCYITVCGLYANPILQQCFQTCSFSGSIAENISYGPQDVSMEGVIAAAKAAGIHQFIMRLR